MAKKDTRPPRQIRVVLSSLQNHTFQGHSWSTSEHTLRIYRIVKELAPVDGQPQFEFETIAEFHDWDHVFFVKEDHAS